MPAATEARYARFPLAGGLTLFHAIVQAGSFVRGGARIGLTQSGTSRAVARLEQQVGVRLFDRNARAVTLTDEGRRFHAQIIDNGPCHNLDENGKRWLANHRHRIELFRLPPYSPELNPIEGVWKVTKKRTTHNRFYKTTDERDAALRDTFDTFQARPNLIANQVARFL